MVDPQKLERLKRMLNELSDDDIAQEVFNSSHPSIYEDIIDEIETESIKRGIIDLLGLGDNDLNSLQALRALEQRAYQAFSTWRDNVARLRERERRQQQQREEQERRQRERVQSIIERQHLVRALQYVGQECLLLNKSIAERVPITNHYGLVADSSVPVGQLWLPLSWFNDVVNLTETYRSFVAARLVSQGTDVECVLSVGQQYTDDGTYRINPHTRELLEHWIVDDYSPPKQEMNFVSIHLYITMPIVHVAVQILSDDPNVHSAITEDAIASVLERESNGLVSVGLEFNVFDALVRIVRCQCASGPSIGGFVKGLDVQEYTASIEIH